MKGLPDFDIQPAGPVSEAFLSNGIFTFRQAIEFIRNLKYGRNSDKDDLKTIFSDNKGTCSTKHAILKQLADENKLGGFQLIMGIFKMNGTNTPRVKATLASNHLDYVPEAHIYLKYHGQVFDFTNPKSSPSDFVNDLLSETEILPAEINLPKIDRHKNYLSLWLKDNGHLEFSLEDIWRIREQCIQDLSA